MTTKPTELATAPQEPIWERQSGESDRAFHGFCVFRDLPPAGRTQRAVQDILYPQAQWATRTIGKWAKEHNWEARASAWDNEVDRVKRDAHLKTVGVMAERHVHQAISLQAKGLEALELIAAGDIDPANARLLIVEGSKLERLSRGEATEKYEQGRGTGLPDLSGYSDDDLRELADAAKRLAAGAGKKESS